MGIEVEEPEGFDFIAEEFGTNRVVLAGREYVNNAAPDGELTGNVNLFDPGEVVVDEPASQNLGTAESRGAADIEGQRVLLEEFELGNRLHQGLYGGGQDGGRRLMGDVGCGKQLAETESFASDFGSWVKFGFVDFGGGQQKCGVVDEGFDIVLDLVGIGNMGGEKQDRAREFPAEDGSDQARQRAPCTVGLAMSRGRRSSSSGAGGWWGLTIR